MEIGPQVTFDPSQPCKSSLSITKESLITKLHLSPLLQNSGKAKLLTNPHLPIYPKVLFPAKVALPEDAETAGPVSKDSPALTGQSREDRTGARTRWRGTFDRLRHWRHLHRAFWCRTLDVSLSQAGLSFRHVCVSSPGHSIAIHDSDYKDESRRASHVQIYVCTHKYPAFDIL